ncbi:hypothetical protein CASFOL_007273 [Castilleja foliolosa]|uniref:DUF1985 domain-containing protein n=1 Tax=Castilleja foliolosa TaxID=1961234 RepID=A0ABD3E8T8_9LAMI
MAMLPDGLEKYRMKISHRSSLQNLAGLVKEHLKEPEQLRFKASCFGHLLNVPELNFQGQLIGQLLLLQDAVPSKDELVFNVYGQKARMRRVDFALVTGLAFGSYPVPSTKSMFCNRVFGVDNNNVRISDLEFQLGRFSEMEGEGEICLKLVMLYVVFGVLLGQSYSKKVDVKYIHLADNFDALNDYPWGRVAFDFLKSRTHDIMEEKLSKLLVTKYQQFDVHGFIQALQVWAYEVLPNVADLCAEQIHPNATPRMGRWKTVEKLVTANTLRSKCFPLLAPGDEGIPIKELKPNNAELRSRYYTSVHKWKEVVEGPIDVDQRKEVKKGKKKVAAHAEENLREIFEPWRKEEKDLALNVITKLTLDVKALYEKVHWQQRRIKWLLSRTGYKGEVYAEGLDLHEVPDDQSSDGPVDPSPDTPVDPYPDTPVDPSPDTSVDPSPDTLVDPSPEGTGHQATAVDSSQVPAVDPSPDSHVDPSQDNPVDPSVGAAVDLPAANSVDSSPDIAVDLPAANTVDSPAPNAVDPSAAAAVDPSAEAAVDFSEANTVDPSAANTVDSPAPNAVDPSAAAAVDPSAEAAVDSSQANPVDPSTANPDDPSTAAAVDPSEETPVGGQKKKKEKKENEAEVFGNIRRGMRTKKKAPATQTPYTNPDCHKKKKARKES